MLKCTYMQEINLKFEGITRNKILPQVFSLLCRNAWKDAKAQITYTDMTNISYNLLGVVYQNNGASQDQIAKALSIDKSQCAKMIASAEKKGYLQRIKDEKDHRIMRVFLTEKGKKAIEELLDAVNHWQEEVLSVLAENEKQAFLSSLYKIEMKAESMKKAHAE